MNPTNQPLTVTLGGQRYTLYFDLNTYEAFERASGKFFLDFLASMEEAVRGVMASAAAAGADSSQLTDAGALQLFRRIAIADIRAFLWAALHDYDSQKEPYWPFTIGQLSRLVDTQTLAALIPKVLTANSENMSEGVEEAAPTEAPARPTMPGTSSPGDGGAPFGPSDADVLGSLTKKSED